MTPFLSVASRLREEAPVLPRPDEGRELLERELSKQPYQPTLMERINEWLSDLLGGAGGSGSGLFGVGLTGALILMALLAIIILALIAGRYARDRVPEEEKEKGIFEEEQLSAAAHRQLAIEALAGGDWFTAQVEAVRAVAVQLGERELIDTRASITATELATEASRRFPILQPRFDQVCRSFNAIRYGNLAATREQAETAIALEAETQSSKPSDQRIGPYAAVPR